MNCCVRCFSNIHLKQYVRAKSRKRGACSLCNNKNTRVLDISELSDLFQPVIELYARDKNGKYLFDLIQRDWCIFCSMKKKHQKEFLNALMGDKRYSQYKYKPSVSFDTDSILKWNKFRHELKHINRFFPQNVPDKDHLARLSEYLGYPKNEIPKVMYRARINVENKPHNKLQMGKPPAKSVLNGRANPIGIPYLYLASDIKTAVAEIKPHKGENVTVASFQPIKTLEIIDLRNPMDTINPFELNEESDLRLIYQNRSYLTLLGEELSKPIVPRDANLEYLPSQFLCELFKAIGTHGIAYKSSVAHGNNFVVFNDKLLKVTHVDLYKVTDMYLRIMKI